VSSIDLLECIGHESRESEEARQTGWVPANSKAVNRGVALLAGVGAAAFAHSQVVPPPSPSDGPGPIPPPNLSGGDPIYLLLQRTTFGFTQEDYALATQMGFRGYLEWQLNYTAIDDSALNDRLAAYTTLDMGPYQLYTLPMGSPSPLTQLQDATLLRAVFSRRQLYEKMVEFWSDHFSIEMNKVGILKVVDDREVARAYGMTTFTQLLWASAHSPGMLVYLDNQTSTAAIPNQNYARELLELHTLGVDNGYTQADVDAAAKCLSGWSLYFSSSGKLYGSFAFYSNRHNNSAKTFLGESIPAGGYIKDGEKVISLLASHPNTAHFICSKLVRRFIADDAPNQLVAEAEATFNATGGNICDVLRTILTERNLIAYAQPRLKRPFHVVASALRASKATVTNIAGSRALLTNMGHLPFRWAPPNGYPDYTSYWSGLLLPRWNVAFSLLNNQVSGASVNASALFQGLNTNTAIAAKINQLLANGNMAAEDVAAVQAYLSPTETDINKIREALALGMCSPSFQWY